MTNNNNNGYIPIKEFNLNLPATATVSYYNDETDQNLSLEEWRALNPVNSNQVQIVNRGEIYQSEKALSDEPSYGPIYCGKGEFSVREKPKAKSCSNGCSETEYYNGLCRECCDNDPGTILGESIAKVALGTIISAVAGPAAPIVGAAIWGTSQAAKSSPLLNDDGKAVFQTFSDIGGGVAVGGLFDAAASKASKEGFGSVSKAIGYTKNAYEVKDWAKFTYHTQHLARGSSYESNCPDCN